MHWAFLSAILIWVVQGFGHFSNDNMIRKYPISKSFRKIQPDILLPNPNYIPEQNETILNNSPTTRKYNMFKPKSFYEDKIRRLNSKNMTMRDYEILMGHFKDNDDDEDEAEYSDNEEDDDYQGNFNFLEKLMNQTNHSQEPDNRGGIRIIINKGGMNPFLNSGGETPSWYGRNSQNRERKSENFEVITKYPFTFADVGGFEKIKLELAQCIEFLSNYTKYAQYNVRVPKGLILEGPPGNGKTMLAKALAGEAQTGFIAVSGSEFQDKYVGVGSSRVRELFELAKRNIPCIIFIDEIDAIGRKRSGDGETSSNERDSTLNELLVALDGFKNTTGIFLIGATNRADLLDPALTRPGRIDKRIYIGLPDASTREAIINIHTKGKPFDQSVNIKDMVDLTLGLSAAQIENLFNEAMLNALRYGNDCMTSKDIDVIMNKMMAGWQPTDHQFSTDLIDQIAIHEMGHAVMGLLCKHHAKMTKVIINLSSPKSPAYTVFEGNTNSIYTKEALFEHLAILLAGRIAEEIFYGVSITTGAINDFEEAFKLAEKMVIYYGMGKHKIYPSLSDKYKEMIDNEVMDLIDDANAYATFILNNCKELMLEGAELLKRDKLVKADAFIHLIQTKYQDIFELKFPVKKN
uniref:AAA+ ATPase domain-containing protein n=1 Tax=viral metagenome TaxID=1070528 RepID=A0A6C0AZS7_9ZZZZ